MKNRTGLLLALAAAVLSLASEFKHKPIIGKTLVETIITTPTIK